jgi:hypothetical protein
MARRLIGVWLMADGIWTGLWFAGLLDSMGGRDMASAIAIVVRLMAAAFSVAAGWLISQRRPAGAPLGIAAALWIALFSLLGAGTGILPTNLDPSFRWPAAWLQTAGAVAAILLLRRDPGENVTHGSSGS